METYLKEIFGQPNSFCHVPIIHILNTTALSLENIQSK